MNELEAKGLANAQASHEAWAKEFDVTRAWAVPGDSLQFMQPEERPTGATEVEGRQAADRQGSQAGLARVAFPSAMNHLTHHG